MRTAMAVVLGIASLICVGRTSRDAVAADADSEPVIVVVQAGKGDFTGTDERPIVAAIAKARKAGGGTIQVGPGEYLVRRGIRLADGITIRGTPQTVLRLASPRIVQSPAKQGQDFIVVDDAAELAADTCIEIFPPVGMETFPVGGAAKYSVEIREIEQGKLILSQQLPHPIPAKSRVGYRSNLFFVGGSTRNVRLQDLTLDGGRNRQIPMPGHCDRCALLAHGVWSYEDGPTAPPIEGVELLNCRIRNCYGRAVAMYSVVRGKVQDCLIEDIDDEAIDLDHFCRHCEVSHNTVRRCQSGVTINDGSYCLVRGNHLEHCGVGVTVWWWHGCPQEDLNVENLIENNVIVSPARTGISLGKKCLRNRVTGNTVEGGITVAEPESNVVEGNTLR